LISIEGYAVRSSTAFALLAILTMLCLSVGPALSMGTYWPNQYPNCDYHCNRNVHHEHFVLDAEIHNFLYGCDYCVLGSTPPIYVPSDPYQRAKVGSNTEAYQSSSVQAAQTTSPSPSSQADAVSAWIGKGNSLYRLGRYDEALASYNTSLGMDPTRAEAWYGKGNALYKLGRFEAAADAYSAAANVKWSNDVQLPY